MKKTLFISFFVFWILATSVVTAALLKWDDKRADTSALSQKQDQSAVFNQLPINGDILKISATEEADLAIQAASVKILDAKEVAKHNSSSDCWMIIDNNVYNFTSYLKQHPGGASTILPYCGKDGSQAYKTKDQNPARDHSDYAVSLFKNYYVGKLGATMGNGSLSNKPALNSSAKPAKTVAPALSSQPAAKTKTAKANPAPAVKSQNTPVISPVNNIQPVSENQGITSATVAAHNKAADCWSVIDGSVYNLTSLTSSHSGGAAAIIGACGKDGTALFNSHSHSAYASGALDAYYLGELASASVALAVPTPQPVPALPTALVPAPVPAAPVVPVTPPAPAPIPQPAQTGQGITSATVATHNTANNCWTIVYNKVYNITSYIPVHPGGPATITPICGVDGTSLFAGIHLTSANANNVLASYYLGNLAAAAPVVIPPPAPATVTSTPPVVTAPQPTPTSTSPTPTNNYRRRTNSDDDD